MRSSRNHSHSVTSATCNTQLSSMPLSCSRLYIFIRTCFTPCSLPLFHFVSTVKTSSTASTCKCVIGSALFIRVGCFYVHVSETHTHTHCAQLDISCMSDFYGFLIRRIRDACILRARLLRKIIRYVLRAAIISPRGCMPCCLRVASNSSNRTRKKNAGLSRGGGICI